MSELRALRVMYITGRSSFTVLPGVFYRVDASRGPVNANLCPTGSTQAGDWAIVKKVDPSGHAVNVQPASGEQVNAAGSQAITGHNQGHAYMPGVPSAYGKGWLSW
jgi:hypothetical protein